MRRKLRDIPTSICSYVRSNFYYRTDPSPEKKQAWRPVLLAIKARYLVCEGGDVTSGLLMEPAQEERIGAREIDAADCCHRSSESALAHHIHNLGVVIIRRAIGVAEMQDRRSQFLLEPRLRPCDLFPHSIAIR